MKKILPLFFFLFSSCILNAQNPEWIVYNSSNSVLPFNDIESIAIDSAGNKWIGTNSHGLIKFDGTNCTVYNTSNSGIGSNGILTILIDNSGDKWLGTGGGGIEKFDDTNFTIYFGADNVVSIASDGLGNKWSSSQGGGLKKFDGTNWTIFNTSNSGLPNNYVASVAVDGIGNKWIGDYVVGLSKFDGTNWTVYTSENSGLPAGVVYSIAIDGAGNKWFGTFGAGLAKFDDTNWTVYNSTNSCLPYNTNIRKVVIDGSGNKWIGTWGDGLAKFDGTTWTLYTTSNSGLPGNYVTSIAIDGSGNKWIGTEGGVAVFKEGGIAVPAAQILNGEFNNGTQGWNLSTYDPGATALMKIDTNSIVSGSNSCAVELSEVTGTEWHIQLWQGLPIYPGHKYTITFKAKASADRSIILALQEGAAPHTTYLYKAHNLTTQVQTFTDEVTINTMDQAQLQFYLGSSTASVWIDAVSIVDSSSSANGIDEQAEIAKNLLLQQNFPNPFSSATTIKYKAREPGFVSIKIFDQMGREVATLVNEKKPVGEYSIDWNVVGLAGGIYFCRLQAGLFSETQKLVLQR